MNDYLYEGDKNKKYTMNDFSAATGVEPNEPQAYGAYNAAGNATTGYDGGNDAHRDKHQ